MKIIESKNYKKAQYFGLQPGRQSNLNKVEELISQGMNVYRAIRMVYPDLSETQIREMKIYFEKN